MNEADINYSPYKAFENRVLYAILFAFFIELALTRIVRGVEDETTRIFIILMAVSRALLVVFLFLNYFLSKKNPLQLPALSGKLAFPFLIFIILSIMATIIGFDNEHSVTYVIGDAFKFCILPLVIFGMMISVRTMNLFKRILKSAILLYALFMMWTIIRYILILGKGPRPVAIYILPVMPVLALYMRQHATNNALRTLWSCVFTLFVAMVPFIILYSRSLSFIVDLLVVNIGVYIIYNRLGKRFMMMVYGVVAISIIFGAAVIFMPKPLSDMVNYLTSNSNYLTQKFYYIKKVGFNPKILELVGGDRISQLHGVFTYYVKDPLSVIFGAGMGGVMKSTPSLFGLLDKHWKPNNHFLESGFNEAFYRTGIIGLGLYVSFFVGLFKTAYRWRHQNLFCALAVSYALFALSFGVFFMGFPSEGMASLFLIGLIFTGTYLIDYEMQHEERRKELAGYG